MAEVKICLSARRAPIVLPPGHERPWQGRNSYLVRRVAVNREVPLKIQTAVHISFPPAHIRVRNCPILPKTLTCSFTNRIDWKFDRISAFERDVTFYRL